MGQQQLLVIIVGVIVIGLAIAAGIAVFTTYSVSSNKDGMTQDLMSLGQAAYGYKLRPVPFGGGGSYYTGFILPTKFISNQHATYAATVSQTVITFTAVSKLGYGSITVNLDSAGNFSPYTYQGDF